MADHSKEYPCSDDCDYVQTHTCAEHKVSFARLEDKIDNNARLREISFSKLEDKMDGTIKILETATDSLKEILVDFKGFLTNEVTDVKKTVESHSKQLVWMWIIFTISGCTYLASKGIDIIQFAIHCFSK
jgi:hypothetical protein